MVRCQDCRHFREYPYAESVYKRKTGCYHPDNMEQVQDDFFLKEQEIPGDHERINLFGDCAQFEAREPRPGFLKRFLSVIRT